MFKYRVPNVMPLNSRPKDEQTAISEYCKSAHPSNIPKNLDAAPWAFQISNRTKKLLALI